MNCPKCDAVISEPFKFCPYCGAERPVTIESSRTDKKLKSKKVWLNPATLTSLIVLLVCGALFIFFMQPDKKIEQTAEKTTAKPSQLEPEAVEEEPVESADVDEEPEPESEPESGSSFDFPYMLGETGEIGDFQVTVHKAEAYEDFRNVHYLHVYVTVKNISDRPAPFYMDD
jgi:hypothetical protein